LSKRIQLVSEYRQRILAARDDVPYSQLRQQLDGAEESLRLPRQVGNTVIAAFFSKEKPKDRENKRIELRELTETALKDPTDKACDVIEDIVAKLASGPKGVFPFHWELEFPEVFTTDEHGDVTGGFDVVVGNPPFAGKNTLIDAHADNYLPWLQMIHPESHGNSDLVAHFFRRAFTVLRAYGRLGLIATNTIGQGDTRSTGLRWICTHGGTIYRARKRLKWPGEAAVVVSVVHVCRGELEGPFLLENRAVPIITAYLFHAGGHEDPAQLKANQGKSFQGSIVLGMGFTFDDTDKKGVTTPLAEMERLIAENALNRERIFPYIGGEELNDSPTHAYHRYVINFEDFPLRRGDVGGSWASADDEMREVWLQAGVVPMDYPEPVAEDWPHLLDIVRQKVRPARLTDNRESYRKYWWKYAEKRVDLYSSVRKLERTLAINCGATPHMSFCFLSSNLVFANTLAIVSLDSFAAFSTLQSRVHEVWARFMASSMKDDLRYTPSDCFETFPFPLSYETRSGLRDIGRAYYQQLFRLSWKWRKRSSVKIAERTYEKRAQALRC
jgi:hypothetical protein